MTARQHGYQLVVVQELKISVSMTSGIPGQAG
ncbi:prophage DLP12 integrase (Prophage QSR' integrase) [Escherichia coli H305]|nr:prophage DLP12 integrase (Prophage QSR' integrase) [Escherichia coli H378]OSL09986.1 prophage DLP12 integrase (Prophage QSR' integrase) [Escherichia coli H296]OSL14727.1 prophage DLP12 integrase (Prophage QSR' integrase) [Escherichia coli H305]